MAVLLLLILIPLSIDMLVRGMELAGKHLQIEHTPTSNCGSVSPGRIELQAEVVAEEALDSPLTDRQVVYYDATVEEWVEDSSDGTRSWETIGDKQDEIAFYVHDDSGRVRIDPRGAEFHPSTAVDSTVRPGHSLWDRGPASSPANSAGKRRFHEEQIAVGDEVYILGTVSDREHLGIPELGSGNGSDPFIISTDDESQLVEDYKQQARSRLTIGTLCGLTIPTLLLMAVEGASLGAAISSAMVPTFFLGLVVAGLIWTMVRLEHRSYIEDLRQRMEKARAMLRREAEHRTELVFELAQMIDDAIDSGDEIDADVEIDGDEIRVRDAYSQRAVCNGIDAQSEALKSLFELARRVPSLQDDEAFEEKLRELTRCEKQLMMARNFYNEGDWRLAQQPESQVGESGRSTTPMTFEPFERKPVDVVLPEDPDSEYAADFEEGAESADDATPPEVPAPPAESSASDTSEPPTVPDDESTGEVAVDEASNEEQSQNEPDEEPPELPESADVDPDEPIVTHEIGEFGVSMDFEGLSDTETFGDDGGRLTFGGSSAFDDVRGFDDDGEGAAREYGFGDGERLGTAGMLDSYGGFGFGKDDQRSVSDDDFGRIDETGFGDDYGFSDEEKAQAAEKKR